MKKIIFLGGGHSNTLAIRSLMQNIYKTKIKLGDEFENSVVSSIFSKYEFNLISEYNNSAYSGMIPGNICGIYSNKESFIDLETFAKIHNCNFIQRRVKKIIPDANKIIYEDGEENNYYLLSINIGSKTYNDKCIKGVDEYTIQTRPINKLINQIENMENKLRMKARDSILNEIKIGIVGGGIAAIELAFSIQYRLFQTLSKKSSLIIFSNQNNSFPDMEKNVVDDLLKIANEKCIQFVFDSQCIEIKEGVIIYQNQNNSEEIKIEKDFDFIVWATGAGANKIDSNLDLDKYGFILVKETLQTLNYDNIFAAGDCIQIDKYKNYSNRSFPPKSGVYAVREGAILANNIFEILTESNKSLKEYIPQPSFLKLITSGDKLAFGTKFGISFYGKWVWNLKEFIDANFVKMFYQELSYDNTLTFDKINTPDNFSYSPDDCIEKLKNSNDEEDFTIQLKIIDRLANDDELLKKIKNKLNI